MELREVIIRQKHDLEVQRSSLFIERDAKIDKNALKSDIIKIIIGPRRAGKSAFIIRATDNENFGYINFDDESLVKIDDYNDILKYEKEIFGDFKFLILDEIQNLPRWELFVNRLQRSGYNLLITGSNSMLLSRELSTHLTGRYLSTLILPFSCKEFIRSKKIEHKNNEIAEEVGNTMRVLREYLEKGGFPEVAIKGLDYKDYLKTLVSSVVLKDILNRYKIRFSSKVYELVIYLIESFTHEISFNSIKKTLKMSSVHTVEKYMEYINEAFLTFRIYRFSFKSKERIVPKSKIYAIDNGIINAYSFRLTENIGKLMENAVAVELMRRSNSFTEFNVNYWKDEQQREVDFVIKNGLKITQLIQVTYASSKDAIKDREIKNLLDASTKLKCNNLLVITWDYQKQEVIEGKKIDFMPLWKWLLI